MNKKLILWILVVALLMLTACTPAPVTTQPPQQTDSAATEVPTSEPTATPNPTPEITPARTPTTPAEEKAMNLRIELDEKIKSCLAVVPEVKEYPAYNPTGKGNIKAITYESVMIGSKKTKVFAYIGYPAGAKAGDKLPAVVLVHGGGGHAFSDWVQTWNKRGYVAIAMDNTGFFPKKANAGYDNADWQYPLSKCPDFAEEGYANVMQTDHFASSGRAIEKQWMYHAVAQAILAHNILKNDPAVDPEKIGITGISWGGIITALTIGYDHYAFAIPQYCAAYLDESLTYSGKYCIDYPPYYDWLWQAEDRYDNVNFPVLWLQWTQDLSATPNTNSLCYLRTKETAEFCLIMNWAHYHDWSPEVIYYFADCALQGKQALAKAVDEPAGRDFSFEITKPAEDTVTARICYMKHPFSSNLDDNVWFFADAAVNGTTVTGTVPEDAALYYVEFTNQVGTKSYFSATSIVYLSE